ncbi:MAG: hypothetical protein Q8K96_10565, partial [Rubrivivax sp.]|nr:hypothetical protein [Rubrivivax sp.]
MRQLLCDRLRREDHEQGGRTSFHLAHHARRGQTTADTPAQQFEAERLYGRAAVAAYVEGIDGRLMRSMKSLLGSSLLDQSTDIGAGR